MTGLDLSAPRVDAICEALDLSVETRARATRLAERADREWPINRSGRVVAASAVYAAGLLCNEKRTQQAVADATGVSKVAIRDAYQELLEHDGHTVEPERDRPSAGDPTSDTPDREPDRAVKGLLVLLTVVGYAGGLILLFGISQLRQLATDASGSVWRVSQGVTELLAPAVATAVSAPMLALVGIVLVAAALVTVWTDGGEA